MMNIERAKELQSSLLWADVVEEIKKKIFHLTEKLHSCSVEQLREIQIEIKVYKAMISLPEDIITREEDVQ